MTTKPTTRRRGPASKRPDPCVLAVRMDEVLREIAASPIEEILASQHIADRPALYDALFSRNRTSTEIIRKLCGAFPDMPVADVEAFVARANLDVQRRSGNTGKPAATPASTYIATTVPAPQRGHDVTGGKASQTASRADGAGSDADTGAKDGGAKAVIERASTTSTQSGGNPKDYAVSRDRRELIAQAPIEMSAPQSQPLTPEALMRAPTDSQPARRPASAAGAPSMESAPHTRLANADANQGGLPAEQAGRTVAPEHPSQPATSGYGQPRELAGRPAFSLMPNGLQAEGAARMHANHGRGIDPSSPAHAGQSFAQSSTEKPAEGSGTS